MTLDGYGQEEEILGKAYDARLIKRLGRYLKPYRWYIVIAIAVLIIASLAELAGPYVTKIAIDKYITPQKLTGLPGIIALFVIIMAVQFLMRYIEVYITQWVGQRTMYDIRMDLFAHVEHLGLSFFDKNPVGRLVTRVTNDINALNELFTSGVVAIFGDIVTLFGIIGFMLYLNWKLALISLVVVPVLFAATMIFRNKVRESFRRVRTRIAKLNAFLQEHIAGMWVVQSFVAEKRTYGKFDFLNRDLRNNHLKSVFYFAVFFPVVEVLGAVSVALIIWYGGSQIMRGALTFGALVAFIQYVDRFYQPIRDLSEKYNILQQAMASSERIFKLLDTKRDIVDRPDMKRLESVKGAIEIENLSFAYSGDDWVLKDINLGIKPGERIAIVGATGAGKTSIISLLLRFYNYQKGDIKLDGVSIRDLPLKEYRRNFALVLQDIFMFSGDISRNIRLGREDISDHDIRATLETVGAGNFVGNLEGGIAHVLRERGSNLSVGQRQLLAFARALAFDPRILILDEATSSVDTQTEIMIQAAMQKLLAGRTSIIIAHRLSTIKNSDRIVVMHKGRIKEEGSHAELLALKGIYHRLYQLQYKDQELAGEAA
jgi:ATP-binding cassette subfamily B multidrug efflux pump